MALTQGEAQSIQKIIAVLQTAQEVPGGPESSYYIFFGMNLPLWEKLKANMIGLDLIRVDSNQVYIQPKGLDILAKYEAAKKKAGIP